MVPGLDVARTVLGPYVSVFACPQCRRRLTVTVNSVACGYCGREYLDIGEGYADFLPAGQGAMKAGHAPLRLQDPVIAARYETHSRPSFFQIMGGNWDGRALTEDGEREYLHGRLASVTGPVADVACGAGRWTRVICDTVGTSRVIGLDISRPLLRQCLAAIPGVVAVRGSALTLPFADGTLGAVVIWNALQQLPSPSEVIAEAGRCLRPGGILVLLTYRPARTSLARYFQARHAQAFSVASFTENQMRSYLARAGLTPADIGGPANFLLATARKRDTGEATASHLNSAAPSGGMP
jgi:SAM-dependent methyltransferase